MTGSKTVIFLLGQSLAVAAWTSCGKQPIVSAQAMSGGPVSIQILIDDAYRADTQHLQIPPGTYKIILLSRKPHLQLRNLYHFQFDAKGVIFPPTGRTRGGIQFRSRDDVTFRGATIRYGDV